MLLVFKEAVSFVKTLELVLVFVANMNLTPQLLDLHANLVSIESLVSLVSPAIKTPTNGLFRK
jgi:hypothetical protein